ncbi:MAG: hypothetical protein FJ303_20690 [Planctomycetes bacterium]|nr:hypothetical protein [Planctomycetota bacterium]
MDTEYTGSNEWNTRLSPFSNDRVNTRVLFLVVPLIIVVVVVVVISFYVYASGEPWREVERWKAKIQAEISPREEMDAVIKWMVRQGLNPMIEEKEIHAKHEQRFLVGDGHFTFSFRFDAQKRLEKYNVTWFSNFP